MDVATTILIVLATIVAEKVLERLARDINCLKENWHAKRQEVERALQEQSVTGS